MPASQTLVVLRDVFVVAMLAMALGGVVYALFRRFTDSSWNLEGNVLTRPYGTPDAAVALGLLAMMGGMFFVPEAAAGAGDGGGQGPELSVSGLVAQMLTMLLLCAVVVAYLRIIRGLNPAEMFGMRQMAVHRAFLFAVVALLLTVTGMIVGTVALTEWFGGTLPDSSEQDTVRAFEENGSASFRLLLAFMAVITAPLTEELIFRGFLYGVVKRLSDRWFAAVFTSLIFAVVHFHVGSAPLLFLLGLGLAIAYEQSGCLLVPVFMHAMFNAYNVATLAYEAFKT